jgi:hypothetical protein
MTPRDALERELLTASRTSDDDQWPWLRSPVSAAPPSDLTYGRPRAASFLATAADADDQRRGGEHPSVTSACMHLLVHRHVTRAGSAAPTVRERRPWARMMHRPAAPTFPTREPAASRESLSNRAFWRRRLPEKNTRGVLTDASKDCGIS